MTHMRYGSCPFGCVVYNSLGIPTSLLPHPSLPHPCQPYTYLAFPSETITRSGYQVRRRNYVAAALRDGTAYVLAARCVGEGGGGYSVAQGGGGVTRRVVGFG
jgi:hypothetical protein